MTKILIIDNEKTIGLLLKDLLKDKGFFIDTASSEEEGYQVIGEHNFDIVIMDYNLKEDREFGFIQKIKDLDPNIVTIIMESHPSFESIQEVLRMGVFDYIVKPFNLDEISFSISRAISYRQLNTLNKKMIADLESHNKKLEKLIMERTEGIRFLFKVTREISSTLGLVEVISSIVSKTALVLNSEKCSILLLNSDSGELVIKYSHGLSKEIIKNTRIKPGEGISGWVFKHQQAIRVEDIESDQRFKIRNKEKYYTNSFLSVPLILREEAIGVINVNDKKTRDKYVEKDLDFVKELAVEASIAIENAKLFSSLKSTSLKAFMIINSTINDKDHYTKQHTDDVAKYSIALAAKMGLSEVEVSEIKRAALLHDLGKVGIHDDILVKKDQLTPEEWEEMKSHPLRGANILRPLDFLGNVIPIIEQHHERVDGQGYPNGLKGLDILLGAKIIAVADSYCAMTTERPHKKAFTKEEALEEIKKNIGSQFSAEVVEAFMRMMVENLDFSD